MLAFHLIPPHDAAPLDLPLGLQNVAPQPAGWVLRQFDLTNLHVETLVGEDVGARLERGWVVEAHQGPAADDEEEGAGGRTQRKRQRRPEAGGENVDQSER